MEPWFDGIELVGRFNWLQTGVWLLSHNGEAAVLEFPPSNLADGGFGPDPVDRAAEAAQEHGLNVKFLLCTHTHGDHFSRDVFQRMRERFPAAVPVLQGGFWLYTDHDTGVQYFDVTTTLHLGGEPLHLIHVPKHSMTDTMVVFRGTACTGDWELGTIRTVNEDVPVETRLRSCDRMIDFVRRTGYRIHSVFSVHANDRREGIDFAALMASTREDRKLW